VPLGALVGLYATLLGLVVGSYLNVVIHRLPRGISTVLPRSRCPSCGAAVAARDNVPVLSYLVLRGRCRHCRAPISPRYPLVEAATGSLFLASYLQFGLTLAAAAGALYGSLLIALAMIDAEHLLLPDRITLPGIALGLGLSHWLPWSGLPAALLGAALGGAVLLGLWGGWLLLRGEEGMGLGDVKMLAMIGAFLGWRGMLVALFVAALAGSAVGLALLASGRGGLKTRLPFGTFLALGGLAGLFAGPALSRWYGALL
jgi:leader peptidase (prepilin peptidase)/N-methyltransferase